MGPEGVDRAFVALPAPPGVCAAIAEARRVWRALDADIRWSDPGMAHVTLRFLGSAPRRALEDLDGRLSVLAGATGPIELQAGATGAFPGWSRPRVLWLGLEAERLSALAEGIEGAARAAGFAPEERMFRAHLTLGRVRGASGLERAVGAVRAWQPPGAVETVGEIVLYRSDLGPGGPRHTAIETYELTGRLTT